MAKDWTLGEKGPALKKETEYAVLVSVITPDLSETVAHEHMDELEFLAQTAGAVTIKRFTQRLPHPENRTFVGKGKVEEIRMYLDRHEEVNMVIFDDDHGIATTLGRTSLVTATGAEVLSKASIDLVVK